MPLPANIRKQIEGRIDEVGAEFEKTKGLILTEEDLRCHLFEKLCHVASLRAPKPTVDAQVSSINLHAEVSWYDEDNKLTIRPDITILEPENLSILHALDPEIKLPSKQFHFTGNAILIELKFVRDLGGIVDQNLADIEDDISKIRIVRDRLLRHTQGNEDRVFCFCVVFNKTNQGVEKIDDLIRRHRTESWFKIIYKSANVTFPE